MYPVELSAVALDCGHALFSAAAVDHIHVGHGHYWVEDLDRSALPLPRPRELDFPLAIFPAERPCSS